MFSRTYISYFHIAHSPSQAHRGTLRGLLCDQFSSQPHPLFLILTEWEFPKQLVRLHPLNLCFWNTLFVRDDDLVFYDRDQFKRVFQSLLITPFSKDKKWMRPRRVQRNLPPPSFQPKYFVLCIYILVYTSIHICILILRSIAKSLGQPNFPATYVSVHSANTDPQCQHYKHHLRRGHWGKHHQSIKQNTS